MSVPDVSYPQITAAASWTTRRILAVTRINVQGDASNSAVEGGSNSDVSKNNQNHLLEE